MSPPTSSITAASSCRRVLIDFSPPRLDSRSPKRGAKQDGAEGVLMKTTRRFFVGAVGSAATWILGFFRARPALAAPERALDAGVAAAHPDAGTASRAPASLLELAR